MKASGESPQQEIEVKRKVDVQHLRVGMYVTELDRPWLETPFLFQGFEIRNEQEIKDLQRYCRYVYVLAPEVHTGAGRLHPPASEPPVARAPMPARDERSFQVEQNLLKLINHPGARAHYEDASTLEDELAQVGGTYKAAYELMQTLMEDARLGNSLDIPGSKKVVREMVDSVIRNPDALICFAQLKKKHAYTAEHSLRVCILALVFGRQLAFDRDSLNVLGIGALLHDIGKMKVPNEILDKPKALDERELEIMKSHVPHGVTILDATPGIPPAAIEVARCHHERYDGRGYVGGLRGDTIGTLGLIGGIVDCYDAITSDRAYHAGISPHAALKKMYESRGSAFHPTLVEQFIRCLGIYPIGSVVELNTGEIGVVAAINRVRRLKPRVVLVRRPDSTPYGLMPAVNLATRTMPDGRPCEIERVLEPEACGINPAYFLPVPALG